MQAVISSCLKLGKIIFKPESETIFLKTLLIVPTKLSYEILKIKLAKSTAQVLLLNNNVVNKKLNKNVFNNKTWLLADFDV